MNIIESNTLTRITASHAAVHFLPTGQPMGESKLTDLLAFAWGLPDAGLPFQARSREDRAAVDQLRRQGLIAVSGQTSGVHVKLTTEGASCFWRLDVAAATCETIAGLPTTRTPWGGAVVLGFELCHSAGPWWASASASAAGWASYLDELASVQTALKPLFVMGWARQYVSTDQRIWAVTLSDAGRDAIDHPPQIEPPPDFVFDADCYRTAWADATRKYSTNPPPCDGSLPRYLPASRWTASQFDASL
jgi:hypothetical protein